jgi:metal-responsive CopG/Arc/MetJ family transcriptional regulator
MISLRLPATAVAELDEICDRSGNTRGSLIQLAVAEWLDRRKKAE